MITFKLKIALVFCLISIMCYGQKCKSPKKTIKRARKHLVEEEIVNTTKFRILFSKFSKSGVTNFVKSDKGYYLALFFGREFGKRIDILETDPIIVQFKNDSIIKLYPDRSTFGKFTLPVTTEINKPFYKVSPEQLQLFAVQPIYSVKIYFTSDKVAENDRGIDDLGTFYDFEILNERYQTNLVEAANCILQ